jgi:DNA topoisomerase 2-associated protein PAT1
VSNLVITVWFFTSLQLKRATLDPSFNHVARSTSHSLEAIWDNKSPLSVLPRVNGASRSGTNGMRRASPAPSKSSVHPPIDSSPISLHVQPQNTNRVRTLQEIEAEMVAAAQQSRTTALQQQQQQQQLLLQQEEDRLIFLQRQQEQELQRHILEYQEQQYQLQIERALQQQQRELQQYQRTPPPRMLPSLSQTPRFHEHQRQILLLQQQQEQQQQQRLQELQQRLRSEELERQLRSGTTLEQSHSPNHFSLHRQPPGPTAVELQAAHLLQQQQRRQRSRSPAVHNDSHFSNVVQDNVGHLHQNVPLQQQRLLSELAQAEFIREIQGSNSQAEQEALRHEAMRKILEAERMEEKRRKKATKIAHMVSPPFSSESNASSFTKGQV